MPHPAPKPPVDSPSSLGDLSEVTATVLKNKFSEVARLASRGPLAVSRHNRREFVILTAEHYEEFQQSQHAQLNTLSADFDRLVAHMSTPQDRAGRAAFFKASAVKPSAALKQLKKRRAHGR